MLPSKSRGFHDACHKALQGRSREPPRLGPECCCALGSKQPPAVRPLSPLLAAPHGRRRAAADVVRPPSADCAGIFRDGGRSQHFTKSRCARLRDPFRIHHFQIAYARARHTTQSMFLCTLLTAPLPRPRKRQESQAGDFHARRWPRDAAVPSSSRLGRTFARAAPPPRVAHRARAARCEVLPRSF